MVLPLAADSNSTLLTGVPVRLFVGDDWAEDHHDVEVMDEAGKVLAKRRLPEGVAGIAQLHELVGGYLGEDADGAEVVVGIETDRGPWVTALIAAGYLVFPVNPLQASRYRERHGVSGPRATPATRTCSRTWCAPTPTSCARRPATRPEAEAVKVLARTHKTLIWERTRAVQRLRHQLREYFPAALEAFEDLDAPDTLELLGKAPDPARAAQADPRPGRRRAQARPPPEHRGQGQRDPGRAARRAPRASPPILTAAYAATARSLIAVITTLNEQVKILRRAGGGSILAGTRTLRSTGPSPALGAVLGARVLGRVRRRPAPLRRRQGPQELRRHQPDHPRLGQEEGRRRPVHPQRPARRRAQWPRPSPR